MIDVLFVAGALLLFTLLGAPVCRALPDRMPGRMRAAPVLGFGLFGMAVTILYRWGLSPGQAGAAMVGVATLVLLRDRHRLVPDAAGRAMVLTAAVVGLLCLLPKWTGGPQYWVFQGNDQDQVNYLAYASAMRVRSFAELMSLTPATAMDNDYLLGAQSMLKARPTVCLSFAALAALAGLDSAWATYAFQVVMQMGMLFAGAFAATGVWAGGRTAGLWVAAALTLGFFSQYIFDINAWSQLASLPMVVVGIAATVLALGGEGSPRPLLPVLGITAASVLYFYPEALMEFGPPLAAALVYRLGSGEGRARAAWVLAGLVAALVLVLPLLGETVALLGRMGSAAAFKPLDWWSYFQRYLFGRDLDYFAPVTAADTPLTMLYALLSLPVDFLAGVMGLHFALPPAGMPPLPRVLWKAALAAGMAGLIFGVGRLARRESGASRLFLLIAATALAVPVGIALSGRFWPAGKALSMASPLLFLVLAAPLFRPASGRGLRLLAVIYLMVHLGLGAWRPLAAADPSGIHYRMPYPGVPDPAYKTALSWNVLDRRAEFASCRHVSLDISHPVLSRYVQMVLSEWGMAWSSRRPLNSYYGNGVDLGLQPQPDLADCLVSDRPALPGVGQKFIWLGRNDAVQGFLAGNTPRIDVVGLRSSGLDLSGWHETEQFGGGQLRWTDGAARVRLPQDPGNPIRTIRLALWPVGPAPSRLRLLANDEVLFAGMPADGPVDMTFTRRGGFDAPYLEIVLQSPSFSAPMDSRRLGLAVRHLELRH
jgi:hypothetical protein